MRYYLISTLLFLLVGSFGKLYGQAADSDQWTEDSTIFLNLSNIDLVYLSASIEDSPMSSNRIVLKSESTFYLFRDTVFYKEILPKTEFSISVRDELCNKLSILGIGNKQALAAKFISRTPSWRGAVSDTESVVNIFLTRNNDHILLLFLIGVLLIVMLRINFSSRFYEIYNLNRSFSLRPLEGDSNRLRVFDQGGIMATLAYLFIFSTIAAIFFKSVQESDIGGVAYSFLKQFLYALMTVASLLFIKVFIIYIASYLFKIRKINTYYVKELINLNLLFVCILFVPVLLVYLFQGSIPDDFHNFLGATFIIIYLLRGVLLYFKILKLSGFTYVYLFSYFCTTELFPFIVGIKYFY